MRRVVLPVWERAADTYSNQAQETKPLHLNKNLKPREKTGKPKTSKKCALHAAKAVAYVTFFSQFVWCLVWSGATSSLVMGIGGALVG